MSTYFTFYIRSPKDEFVEVRSYSRNSELFDHVRHYPFGKPVFISESELKHISSSLAENKSEYEKDIARLNERIALVATFNNSMDEKLETVTSYEGIIKEMDESVEEITDALYFLDFLRDYMWHSYENSDCVIAGGIETGDIELVDGTLRCADPST